MHRPLALVQTAALAATALAALACPSAALAGEVYGSAGLPGVMLGFAQPMSETITLRADVATLGSRSKQFTEEGITYDGSIKTQRVGVYADWFPMAGSGMRLTGGVTVNDYQLKLNLQGAGRVVTIGDHPYTLGAGDGMDVKVAVPDTTPYLGLGWGHHGGGGWRMALDLGASFGKAAVTVTPRGALANPGAQADVDKELAQLRDGVGKLRVVPQVSLSLGYSF